MLRGSNSGRNRQDHLSKSAIMLEKEWDAFISHASEDKDEFVRPLAQALAQLGVNVWYDEFTLEIGESLSKSIDKGLANSTYGIVVISPSFIQKKWPERELRGLVAREIEQEQKVILPIWLGVTKQEVLSFSPPLADTLAITTEEKTAEEIALTLLKTLRPDIYKKHPRGELEKMVSGEALQTLEDELENVKYELSEYRCPHCQAPLIERTIIEPEPDFGGGGLGEDFACGYRTLDDDELSPCPSDPTFPTLEEYEFQTIGTPVRSDQGAVVGYFCELKPKTKNARRLRLDSAFGETKELAEQKLIKLYDVRARRWKGTE